MKRPFDGGRVIGKLNNYFDYYIPIIISFRGKMQQLVNLITRTHVSFIF